MTTARISRATTVVAVLTALVFVAGVAAVGAEQADASSRSKRNTRRWPSPTTTAPKPTTVPAPTTTAAPAPTTTTPTPTTTATAPPTTTTPPASGGSGTAPASVLFGVATEGGPTDQAGLDAFEANAGKEVSLYGSYASFAYDPHFNAAAANAVRANGAQPMVTWEPWDPGNGTANQPSYSLSTIVNGAHDAYITRWATEIKAWGHPLWLRFAHEMNGNWYPWAAGVNGNTAAQYASAWRHVRDVFASVGVTNVTWVWNPNVDMPGAAPLSQLYPGDAYVDWLGVDGYNWGTGVSWGSWQSFDQVFGPTLSQLRSLSSKPIVIGETSSSEVGGSKATWIEGFFSSLAANPDIKAFVWFNLNKETDWRIESSAAARQAFAAGAADPRYRAG